MGKKYVFPANESKLEAIRLESEGAVTLVTRFNVLEQRIVCGRGTWQKRRATSGLIPEQPATASGARTAAGVPDPRTMAIARPVFLAWRAAA